MVFWNIKSQERHTKFVKRLYGIASSEDHCVVAAPHGEEEESGSYMLSLCNSLGTTVDSKQVAKGL